MPAVPVTRGAHCPLVSRVLCLWCPVPALYPHRRLVFTRSLPAPSAFLPVIYPQPTSRVPTRYPHPLLYPHPCVFVPSAPVACYYPANRENRRPCILAPRAPRAPVSLPAPVRCPSPWHPRPASSPSPCVFAPAVPVARGLPAPVTIPAPVRCPSPWHPPPVRYRHPFLSPSHVPHARSTRRAPAARTVPMPARSPARCPHPRRRRPPPPQQKQGGTKYKTLRRIVQVFFVHRILFLFSASIDQSATFHNGGGGSAHLQIGSYASDVAAAVVRRHASLRPAPMHTPT